jgi:DNA-binding transcriptional LysR family regulator
MSDLTTYKLLDAVARYGSVRKAATQASITPSALNRRILAIEEEFGTPLFERTPSGLRPNTAGELVLMHIRQQFADLDKVKSQIADLSGVRLGTIRLAGSPAVLPHYFPTKIRSYLDKFPGVDFRVYETFKDEAEAMLKQYEADVAVVLEPQSSPDIMLLGNLNQVVNIIIDEAHPLAKKTSVSLADCATYPLAIPGENTILHDVLQRISLATQVDLFSSIRSSNLFFIVECVHGSQMISFRLLTPDTDPALPNGLVARPIAHPQARTVLKLIQLKGRTLSVAASRFVEHIAPDFDA